MINTIRDVLATILYGVSIVPSLLGMIFVTLGSSFIDLADMVSSNEGSDSDSDDI